METIKYTYKENWLAVQEKAEQEMLAELEQGNYTLEHPLVKYNLYSISPLTAVVAFKTPEETAITLTVKGKTKQADMYHTFPKAKTHILPVLGLYNNYLNTIELRPYRGTASAFTIQTPDTYEGKEIKAVMKTTPEYLQDNLIFEAPADENLASAFDYAGDTRWHLSVPCIFDLKRLKNGRLLIGTDRLIKLPYYVSGLYEMDMVGKIYKEYCLPGGYHHDQFEMPNGDLLSLTEDFHTDTVEDMLVLIDRETGAIKKTWDYKNFLKPGCSKSGSWSDEDWFHNNAVWYDENTNSLTLSGRHIDAMVNIDYETGKLNWIIGDPEGWDEEYLPYMFKPEGDEFDWQYEQHACVITPDGDVMCFDNHHYGSKNKETYKKAKDSYSRGVRFRINTKDKTIRQIWQYGKEQGAEFFSPYICNVEYYNEGHYMVHSGGISYMNGEPAESLGAFTRNMPGGTLETRTVEVCDGKVMLELTLPANYYRAEKLKLYTDGTNLDLGAGKQLGTMGVTPEFETDIPMEPCGELLPASCEASIEEEDDRFTFHSKFEKGQMVMLLLEGKNGEESHRYYISTTAVPYLAMCCGTFMDSDERSTRTFVNKAGITGEYDVRVIIDDKKYETGICIKC
ncbi:MAG: aryl-sulfate sulfotransferase [Lachnospiraceae bacterium]|nr:aryl-sulfate sulfotransferase [Lachnospiraceae bacterium]